MFKMKQLKMNFALSTVEKTKNTLEKKQTVPFCAKRLHFTE